MRASYAALVALRDLVDPESPRIGAFVPARKELVLGAFQRPSQLTLPPDRALVRRASGGGAVRVGPGTVHLVLTLPKVDALLDARPETLVNRHVRPLLRALGRLGAPGFFGGRDFVSVTRAPVAWVGFAHDAASGSALFEAFVAVTEPFAGPELLGARGLTPFRGHAPQTLAALATLRLTGDAPQVASVLLATYDDVLGPLPRLERDAADLRAPADAEGAPWDATVDEAVGLLGADAEPPRFGGDFFASEGLVATLERAAAAAPGDDEDRLWQALESALQETPGALEGLRSRRSLAQVLVAARRKRQATSGS